MAIRAMKAADFVASIYPGTDAGLVAALAYAGTRGKVVCGPGDVTLSSVITVPTGAELQLGGGYYTLSGAAKFSLANLATLRGQGRLATVILADPTFSATNMVVNADQSGGQQWCSCIDLQIDGNRTNGASVTRGLYFKAVGQPGRTDGLFVTSCSGDGIVIESSSHRMVNCEGNNCLGYNIRLISGGDVRLDSVTTENIASGKAGIFIDGVPGPSSFQSSAFYFTGIHVESIPDNTSQGILISSAKNISINGVKYFGGGGVGDLVKIVGATTDSYGITLQNITASIASVANLLVDSTRSHTIANTGSTGTITLYTVGGESATETFSINDPQTFYGAGTFKSTLRAEGATTLVAAVTANSTLTVEGAATVAKTGTNASLTVGPGGTGTETASVNVNSGSNAAGIPTISLSRNSAIQYQAKYSPGAGAIMFLLNAPLFIADTGEVVGARWVNTGKLRLGDNANPTQMLEVVGSVLSTALTSGRYPKISTGGLLIDGPTPLAGTKIYWVSDTSGGAVNRKLTFTDGILTAET